MLGCRRACLPRAGSRGRAAPMRAGALLRDSKGVDQRGHDLSEVAHEAAGAAAA